MTPDVALAAPLRKLPARRLRTPRPLPSASLAAARLPQPTPPTPERDAPATLTTNVTTVTARVPATCANLGPGFDCLGLALDLANEFAITAYPDGVAPTGKLIEAVGAPADVAQLALDDSNLLLCAFRAVYARLGLHAPTVTARITVRLPPGRGLGSSATAVVGGVLIANTLLGQPLSPAELLEVAIGCEPGGHADNVASALLGGLVVTGARALGGGIQSLALPVPPELRAVLFIPDQPMSTTHGRSLLPAQYDRSDVTFNLSRVALLLAALQSGRFDLLSVAMDDRVHQPYRERLFPALGALIAAGRSAGAHGVCLSGGGSSVLALTTSHAEEVRDALAATARALGVAGYSVIAQISRQGAQAQVTSPDALAPVVHEFQEVSE